VLDAIAVDGCVADTAAVDLSAAVNSARALFAVTPGARLPTAAQRRRCLQEWLSGSPEAVALGAGHAPPAHGAAPLRTGPAACSWMPVGRGQFVHVGDFGRRAREVLAGAFGDYVASGDAVALAAP